MSRRRKNFISELLEGATNTLSLSMVKVSHAKRAETMQIPSCHKIVSGSWNGGISARIVRFRSMTLRSIEFGGDKSIRQKEGKKCCLKFSRKYFCFFIADFFASFAINPFYISHITTSQKSNHGTI